MFLEELKRAALEKCNLIPGKPILLGVSGGADSLALMHGLNALGFELIIAHLDHAIRPESQGEADFVEKLAASFDLPFVRKRRDVKTIAEQEGQSLEEAAREIRYQFLFNQARLHQAQAVAVAHHADDQVETVLMHLLRGAALPGLSGMPYRRVMHTWDIIFFFLRPLLGFRREEINAYVADIGLEPCFDLSNLDTTYFRNRLRHELIPNLKTYNPQVRQILWRMADVLRAEDHFLDDLTEEAWKENLIARSEDTVELRRSTFINLDKALQRRILRRAIALLRPDLRDVGFDAVERGLAFIIAPSKGKEIDLVARLNIALLGDILIVTAWDADLPEWDKPLLPSTSFNSALGLNAALSLKHGWRINATHLQEVPDAVMDQVDTIDAHEAWLDFDTLEMPLTVRGREEGEVWQPLGMAGHSQKISDFFINEKVPAHLRDLWPLVCSGEQIAWVVGMRPSEVFKVTRATQRVLELRLIRD